MAIDSSAAARFVQQRRCFGRQAAASTFPYMGKEDRRAKVTPETKAESAKLAELWQAHRQRLIDRGEAPLTQAQFGEDFGVGNQSYVGQVLRGDAPLSLKAAQGFAQGLGCRVEDFSPRLAAKAASIARLVPSDSLSKEAAEIAYAIDTISGRERKRVIAMCREIISLARPRDKRAREQVGDE